MIEIPQKAKKAMELLNKAGFEAFLVGGSVRNLLMGQPIVDIDMTTSATPSETLSVFKDYKCIETGLRFGTVTVLIEGEPIEITTYRSDGDYQDHRRPDKVTFEKNIVKDLQRRDFTVNAMAYHEETGLMDPFGGREDLKAGLLRAVGEPAKRFQEDALRLMRGVRFAAQLDFQLEDNTKKAMITYGPEIMAVSPERIGTELSKIMRSRPWIGLPLMVETGLMAHIIPEAMPMVGFDQKNPYHSMDVFNHTLCLLQKVSPKLETRFAAFFHDIGKPYLFSQDEEGIGHFYGHDMLGSQIAVTVLRRLRYPEALVESVGKLVQNHMIQGNHIGNKGIKRLLGIFGEDIWDMVDLHQADTGCTRLPIPEHSLADKIKEILDKQEPFSRKALAINGNDLIALGYEGKSLGAQLDYLLELVMENPEMNTREILLNHSIL